jgi:hypothetical protein
MTYKTIVMCALLAGSMQNAWGMHKQTWYVPIVTEQKARQLEAAEKHINAELNQMVGEIARLTAALGQMELKITALEESNLTLQREYQSLKTTLDKKEKAEQAPVIQGTYIWPAPVSYVTVQHVGSGSRSLISKN